MLSFIIITSLLQLLFCLHNIFPRLNPILLYLVFSPFISFQLIVLEVLQFIKKLLMFVKTVRTLSYLSIIWLEFFLMFSHLFLVSFNEHIMLFIKYVFCSINFLVKSNCSICQLTTFSPQTSHLILSITNSLLSLRLV